MPLPSHLVKKFITIYETQRFVTPVSIPSQINPLHVLRHSFYPPIYAYVFQVVSFPYFLNQNPVCIYILLRYVFQVPPSLSSVIWLRKQKVKLLSKWNLLVVS